MPSEDELKGQLREQGVEDIGSVKVARLEGGRLSVLKKDSSQIHDRDVGDRLNYHRSNARVVL